MKYYLFTLLSLFSCIPQEYIHPNWQVAQTIAFIVSVGIMLIIIVAYTVAIVKATPPVIPNDMAKLEDHWKIYQNTDQTASNIRTVLIGFSYIAAGFFSVNGVYLLMLLALGVPLRQTYGEKLKKLFYK